jgi:hypothetical protein
VNGVIGYPAKNRQSAAMAASAMAYDPSINRRSVATVVLMTPPRS